MLIEIPVPFVIQIKGVKRDINLFTEVKEIKGEIIHFFDPEKYNMKQIALMYIYAKLPLGLHLNIFFTL